VPKKIEKPLRKGVPKKTEKPLRKTTFEKGCAKGGVDGGFNPRVGLTPVF